MLVFFVVKLQRIAERHKTEKGKIKDSTRKKTLQEISLDLHDDVGNSLAGIEMFVQMAKLHVDVNNNPRLAGLLNKIDEYSQSVFEKTKDLVWMLKPENDNSPKTIERLCEFAETVTDAAGIQLEIHLQKNFVLPVNEPAYRRNVFLIGKEAVNNAIKHSGCTCLSLRIEHNIISISDNGKGFDMANEYTGNGRMYMKWRAKESGIRLNVQSRPGEGCTVTLHL
ncbi:MAG: hypothetical protein JNM68_05000 [Dinghuibacter sp.]|nr:hypothetical protein [Dinghuibacter sp.]